MADETTTPPEELTLDEATLASLEIPELEPESPPAEAEPEPEPQEFAPEPETTEEPVRESREQMLARRLAEQEALSAQLARDLAARSQPPPQPQQHAANPWAHLPADQQKQWEGAAPIVRAMFSQMIAPLVPVIQKANEGTERLALRNARWEPGHPQAGQIKYPDAADYEETASQMRWNHYQQTGQWQPLELAYLVAKGAGMLRQPSPPVREQAQRTKAKRGQAARTAAAGSVTPQQGQPGGTRLTEDRIRAMSDEQFRKEFMDRAGIERLDVQARRRRA